MAKNSFPRKTLLKRSLKKFAYFVDEVAPELPGLNKTHSRAIGSLLFNPFPARRLRALTIIAKHKQPISVDVLVNALRFETHSQVKAAIMKSVVYHFRKTPELLKTQLPWLERRLRKEDDDLSRYNLLKVFQNLRAHGLLSPEDLGRIYGDALVKEKNSSIREFVFNALITESNSEIDKLPGYRRNPKTKPPVFPQVHLAYFPVYAKLLEDLDPDLRNYAQSRLKQLVEKAKFYSPQSGPGEPTRVFSFLNGQLTPKVLRNAHEMALEEIK
ncbi:HEAT repeat domain-containing protein [Candidatus Micrarchaeota archaeon]|nr:HEAT repeat domain-containing protein [Candidatus Micrarchaeota archaeon]